MIFRVPKLSARTVVPKIIPPNTKSVAVFNVYAGVIFAERVPSPVIDKLEPILIPPSAEAVAVVNVYGVATEIVPSPVILTLAPILTPPSCELVAVVEINLAVVAVDISVLVLTLIVASPVTLMPVPILTPPSCELVAVVRTYEFNALTLPLPSIDKLSPIITPPIKAVVAVCKANDAVVTEIVPSALTPIPVPIFTPPNCVTEAVDNPVIKSYLKLNVSQINDCKMPDVAVKLMLRPISPLPGSTIMPG